MEGWAEANPYSSWTEPADNATWDQVMAGANALVQGRGRHWEDLAEQGPYRDETATSYDDATQDTPVVTIQAGDSVAVTVQGYTGGYGDDWDAFDQEWDVEWAVLEGSVTDIQLTHEASETPLLRPATVSLAMAAAPM